jgi:hypothetical protein
LLDQIARPSFQRRSRDSGKPRRYLRRQASVEPVVGIIKKVLGFEQFSLRGLQKVSLEWTLVCAAYNLKRLPKLLNPANQKPKTPKPPKPTPPVLVQLLSELFGLYCLALKPISPRSGA